MDRRTTITVAIGALMVFRSSARLISSIFSLRLDRNLQIWCFLSRVAISESDADNTITPLSSMVLAVSVEKLASIPKSGPEIKNHCTLMGISGENLASIRKSGPEIKNRCTLMGISGENPASIPKSGLEIKNRCTKEELNRQNLASIRKFGPEIKNRCTLEEESGQETLEGVNTDNVFIQWNGNDKRKRV